MTVNKMRLGILVLMGAALFTMVGCHLFEGNQAAIDAAQARIDYLEAEKIEEASKADADALKVARLEAEITGLRSLQKEMQETDGTFNPDWPAILRELMRIGLSGAVGMQATMFRRDAQRKKLGEKTRKDKPAQV
jgi:hypothetical protein